MDAIKYMKKTKEMCSYYTSVEGCTKCPLYQYDLCLSPCDMGIKDIEISIDIVKQWSKTHRRTK